MIFGLNPFLVRLDVELDALRLIRPSNRTLAMIDIDLPLASSIKKVMSVMAAG